MKVRPSAFMEQASAWTHARHGFGLSLSRDRRGSHCYMEADRVTNRTLGTNAWLGRVGGLSAWLALASCGLDDDRVLQPRTSPSCGSGGGSAEDADCPTGGKNSKGGATGTTTGGKANSARGGSTAQPEGGSAPITGGSGGDPDVLCPDLDNNGTDDCQETLALNPSFNADAEKWKAESEASATWDSYDGTAQLNSGSILIENKAPASTSEGQVTKTATQCIPLTGGHSYVVLAQMYIQGNMVRGYGLLSGYFFDGEDCDGTVLLTGISPQNGTISSWRTLGVTLAAPAPARSLLLGLGVSRRTDDAEPFSARFDNVLVKKAGN